MDKRVAVILFNLGGPDSAAAVKPFLYNLFSDKAIIRLPFGFRHLLAWIISSSRHKTAQEIYSHLGGKSPILEETQKQAEALLSALKSKNPYDEFQVFISMRYWHPFSHEIVKSVQEWSPDEIILLPLYPHFSTTTTESSLKDWSDTVKKHKVNIPTKYIQDYYLADGFVDAQADLLLKSIAKLKKKKRKFHVLFSAHGLPESIIKSGDPYETQIYNSALSIAAKAKLDKSNWDVTFQSRVGPTKWIRPYTDSTILDFYDRGIDLVLLPISFVSEHSETLVEMDIEYKELAELNKVSGFERIKTLGVHPLFINCLADLCLNANKILPSKIHSF